MKQISFKLNGENRQVFVDPTLGLSRFLREQMGLKSLKCGCERGDCGTCTIWIDGQTVRSCLILAVEIDGHEVTTLEGLMEEAGGLTPLQQKLYKDNAYQCGFCAPGMLMSLEALLKENKKPSEEELKEAIGGNLCRCTGYEPILTSVRELTEKES